MPKQTVNERLTARLDDYDRKFEFLKNRLNLLENYFQSLTEHLGLKPQLVEEPVLVPFAAAGESVPVDEPNV